MSTPDPANDLLESPETKMPTTFLSLSGELRNKIYELVLVKEEPIVCYRQIAYRRGLVRPRPRRDLTPGLLRANKLIHREAASILYAQNCLVLSGRNSEPISTFLSDIGRDNASHIREIQISFPSFLNTASCKEVKMTPKAVSDMEFLQQYCVNVEKVELERHFEVDMSYLYMLNSPRGAEPDEKVAKLTLIDACLRKFPCLKEIASYRYQGDDSETERTTMDSLGWTDSRKIQ